MKITTTSALSVILILLLSHLVQACDRVETVDSSDNEIFQEKTTTTVPDAFPEERLDPVAITSDFMQIAFADKYFWQKLAIPKAAPENEFHRSAARSDYPITNPKAHSFGPDTELPIRRIAKWKKRGPITITVVGAARGDGEDTNATFRRTEKVFNEKVAPLLKGTGISLKFVAPEERTSRRTSAVNADITIHFTTWGGGSVKWLIPEGMGGPDFLDNYDLYDAYEIPISIPIAKEDSGVTLASGQILLNDEHHIEAAICNNRPTITQPQPSSAFLFNCIAASLGLPRLAGHSHDEQYSIMLLRILYDSRIKPGMPLAQAESIVSKIAYEEVSKVLNRKQKD